MKYGIFEIVNGVRKDVVDCTIDEIRQYEENPKFGETVGITVYENGQVVVALTNIVATILVLNKIDDIIINKSISYMLPNQELLPEKDLFDPRGGNNQVNERLKDVNYIILNNKRVKILN